MLDLLNGAGKLLFVKYWATHLYQNIDRHVFWRTSWESRWDDSSTKALKSTSTVVGSESRFFVGPMTTGSTSLASLSSSGSCGSGGTVSDFSNNKKSFSGWSILFFSSSWSIVVVVVL